MNTEHKCYYSFNYFIIYNSV